MDHREYIRVSNHTHTAVLMLHGIIGSPRHFDMLIPLIPSDWSIYNILLDGHGKTVSDFSNSSMTKWRQQVANITDELCRTYDRVVLIGHSMGTLLAIEQALRYPQKISALILLASPLKVRIKLSFIKTSLKATFGTIQPDDILALATRRATSVMPDKRLWRYLGWIPRFWELLGRIRITRTLIPQVTVPSFVWQSRQDELVSPKSARYFEGNTCFSVRFLENSGHYYYTAEDVDRLKHEVVNILKNLS